MSGLTDAEWDDLRSENMYDTEEGVRRFVDRLLAERMAVAWREGFKQGGPMHDEDYDDPDAHTRNPYESAR